MEARQKLVRVPARPVVLLVALLCAIAIALMGWYAVTASTPALPSTATVTSVGGFPGPDARERNQQLQHVHDSSGAETVTPSSGLPGPDARDRNQQLQRVIDSSATESIPPTVTR